MAQAVERTSPQDEGAFLSYTGNAIPWYVRVLWLIFWVASIAYVVTWLLPALQTELITPP